jgi:hypothetical protein
MGIPDVEGAEEIGRGGFGVVYKAHQSRFDRTVAVKVLEQAQLDESGRQRFERECKALGALSGHPNVVTIYDSGFTPNAGWPFLVLEYLPDGSLGDRVDREGPLDIDQATELIIKICGALETAHRTGVLHRDLKPENILMGAYDEPKLGDFGIARVQGATVTATSTIWGSPAHAAPEIIEGKGASAQTDIYSLGSTLYVLLSGKLAFQRDTDESIIPVLARIATEPPPDLRPIGVPPAVWAVVERMMAKDPTTRQATAMDVGRELQQAREAVGLPAVEMRVRGERSVRRGASSPLAPGQAASVTATSVATPPPAYSGPVETPAPAAYSAPVGTPPGATPTGTVAVGSATPPPGAPPPGYDYATTYPPGYPGAGYPSGPVGPYPPTSGPLPPAGRSNKIWLLALVAFVLVAAIVTAVVVATRPGPTPPPTSLADSSPSNPTVSSPVTAAPPASDNNGSDNSGGNTNDTGGSGPATQTIDLKDALLDPHSIPGTGWTVSANADSFDGFSFLEPCNNSVDASSLTQQAKNLFAGKTPGGQDGMIFQAVGQFASPDDAKSFIDAIPNEISCQTWTDSSGEDHDIITQDLQNPVGDQSLLLEDIVTDSGKQYDHDLAFYREGEYVGFVTNLTIKPNDESFTEQLLGMADSQLKNTVG